MKGLRFLAEVYLLGAFIGLFIGIVWTIYGLWYFHGQHVIDVLSWPL